MCEGLCEGEAHQGVLGECRRRQDSLGTSTATHSELQIAIRDLFYPSVDLRSEHVDALTATEMSTQLMPDSRCVRSASEW